ncbi:MAG: hypothetical protein ACYCOY_02565 [Metallibacterium sp.]
MSKPIIPEVARAIEALQLAPRLPTDPTDTSTDTPDTSTDTSTDYIFPRILPVRTVERAAYRPPRSTVP